MNPAVLITGVSSGLGHGLAAEYLDRRWRVYGVSRRIPADLINRPEFRFASVDLRQEAEARLALTDLLADPRHLNSVILNAGVLGQIADMRDTTLSQLQELMAANVWSAKTTLDAAFAACPQIDQVIAISSGAAVNGNRGWNGYAISKAALNMLVQLYAREQEDTHFVAVAPGLIDTAMQDYLCSTESDPRFPSLQALKSKRGTAEMPDPAAAASRLAKIFDEIKKITSSGQFIDVRQLPNTL